MSSYDLHKHLVKAIKFSRDTYGPGFRYEGVLDHIEKEIKEIRAKPSDLEEWIDIWILAMDGATRCVEEHCGQKVKYEDVAAACISMLKTKVKKNYSRKWPDWRTADPNKAIEHLREFDPNAIDVC